MAQATTVIPIMTETASMPEPQTRGYVINLVRQVSASRLELEIDRAAQAGFNLLIFPIYNNGWTLFPSEQIRRRRYPSWLRWRQYPRINPLFRKWDPLAHVLAVAARHGMKVWGFARPYDFRARHTITEHRLLKAFPQWRMRTHPDLDSPAMRRLESHHACPLNQDYQRMVADVLTEAAERYPLDGIMINYTGLGLSGGDLANSPFCYCASCRTRYWREHDAELVDDARGEHLERVRRWQMEAAHDQFVYLRLRLARTRRTMRVICRAMPSWRFLDHIDQSPLEAGLLMDWRRLTDEGMAQVVALHHDGERCGPQLSARIASDYAFLGDQVLFLPMVMVNDLEQLRHPLALQARFPVPGFIAEFQTTFTEEDAEFIRSRFFTEDAPLPEDSPVRTAAYFIDRVRREYQHVPLLEDFFSDVLRLLSRELEVAADFDLLEVVEENLRGLEQAIRRGRLGEIKFDEPTMCDLGLARRFVRLACLDVRA